MESIRLKVLHEALQDLRALHLLENWMTRQEILAMIKEATDGPVEFDWRSPDDAFLLKFREKINGLIRDFTAG